MSDERTRPRPASLGRALSRGFRAAYDHLGYVVFATFLAFVAVAALFSLAARLVKVMGPTWGMTKVILFIPAALAAWLAAVGMAHFANKVAYHEYPVLGDTWSGIRSLLGHAIALFALDLLVMAVLLGDAAFFFSARGNTVFLALGILSGYILFVWLAMCMYHLPLLPAQAKMESGPRPLVIVRKSFLLAADNPGFTVGLFLAIIALAVVCAVPGFVGMAAFYLGATTFVLTHALRELFIKYGITEDEPEVVEDRGWPKDR